MNNNDILLNAKKVANKQDKNDSRLLTNSKEIVGAINENKSSLEDNKKLVNIRERGLQRPVISFCDDDGAKEVYSRLYPIMKSKNVPFGSAIITGLIGTNAQYMTLAQLKEIYDSGLYETLSHTVDVTSSLTDIAESDLDRQINDSKKWLIDNGFEVRGFVYPQSNYNLNIKKKVSNNYEYAFGYMGVNPNGYLDHFAINRIAFGSYTDGNPTVNGNSEKNTLAYYKACVDYCFANKTWLTFMLHISPQPTSEDTVLAELIDYIKSKGIEIKKPSEAFKIKSNKLSVGLKEEKHLWLGENGVDINFGDYQIVKLDTDRVGNGTSSDFYENDKITYCLINQNVANFPEGRPGVLITDKIIKDRQYAMQTYRVYKSGNTYERIINNDGSYSIWRSIKTNVKLENNSVSSTTPIGDFPIGCISYCLINKYDLGLPDGSAGVLETNRLIEDYGYAKQIFRKSNNRGVYERTVLSDTTYSEWVCVSNVVISEKAKVSVPLITIPASSIIDTEVNLNGLLRATSYVHAVPSYGLDSGLMYNVFSMTDGKFTIRVQNTSISEKTISAREWIVNYIV